ncbi:hypothetical protein NDN08_006971 [Rhodosorus marinus]|uniref:Tubulin-specific chaperone A n=1 Tax=Rhodosorus marinus TaxID=101924 RepID=A0AAV8UJ55_9RHOD|nr:hypothetical protein NDN08_006971 [Rhodosorus marinus]
MVLFSEFARVAWKVGRVLVQGEGKLFRDDNMDAKRTEELQHPQDLKTKVDSVLEKLEVSLKDLSYGVNVKVESLAKELQVLERAVDDLAREPNATEPAEVEGTK